MSRYLILNSFLIALCFACNLEDNYDKPGICENSWKPNTSLVGFLSLYNGEMVIIQEDLVLEAYVISSDQEGNIFGTIYLQDAPRNPISGIQVLVDLPDSYLFYPLGSRILIRLKGMYLGKDGENFQLGSVTSFFGNKKVGRLPKALIEQHLRLSCEDLNEVSPKPISLRALDNQQPGIIVVLDSVEFIEEQIGLPYAESEEETSRSLQDCNGNTIELLNSGYADFAEAQLPEGSGNITGILSKDRDKWTIILNHLTDVKFTNERCPSGPDPKTSDSLFISEIADPDNNSEARFVELFNAGSEELPLKGWTLERYTNENTQVSSVIDLSELSIAAKEAIIIAANANIFNSVFGFHPHIEAGNNSPADSNGDDNLVLKDPFGVIKDIFGRIAEDGSNTDHEFEDGKALRKIDVEVGNPIYDPTEWILYNDTGLSGTINQPQLAPQDFTPGKR